MNTFQDLSKEQLITKINELTVMLQTLQEEKNKQVEELSRTDFLTKLNNRKLMFEKLAYETKRSTRTKEPLSILLLDIDHFKQVNTQHGHAFGDQVLVEIAKIIVSSVRVTDIVGRVGGEEFMVILPACNATNASNVAELIRESVELNIFEDELRVTVSGGIHQYQGESVDQCIEATDKILQLAKLNGRNRIELSTVTV